MRLHGSESMSVVGRCVFNTERAVFDPIQTPAQVCCRVLSLQTSNERDAEDDGSPWWHLIGVLLPPFLHGLCMCSNRSRIAEGMLPSLVSMRCRRFQLLLPSIIRHAKISYMCLRGKLRVPLHEPRHNKIPRCRLR